VHARTEWDTPKALAAAVDAINEQSPDIVVACGDLITDGFQSSAKTVAPRWDTYMRMHNSLDGEAHAAIGNHDLVAAIPEDGSEPSDDPRRIFREKLGVARTYYSFDALGYHVMLLDSIQILGKKSKYQGLIDPEQMQWIEEDLAGLSRDRPIILAMHIPLLTGFFQATAGATIAAPAGRVVVNNIDVFNLFRDHNLILVLQGHLHITEMLRWKNTTFITGGALSGKWWRGSYYDTPEGFNLVILKGNKIEWEYLTYGWEARRPPDL
jgi:3',5'-cyclic AMP phosphodiesterase CpdA